MTPFDLTHRLQGRLEGDVVDSQEEREKYSRDTSLFKRVPSTVVYPKHAKDVSQLVKTISELKAEGHDISLTARSAGTCMSGGSLTTSVVAVFTKYCNNIISVERSETNKREGYATVEPGCYYRDFEKATLEKNLILPSYPASKSICALGGIVNNDSGGERTLEYGKTHDYIEAVDVVLSDGTTTTFSALTEEEVEKKEALQNFEGKIYREMSALLKDHGERIQKAKPRVSKNSAGYALWDIIDPVAKTMNLAKLICGAQGTLAMVTQAKLRLIKPQPYRAMLVVFMKDLETLPEVVARVLKSNPESFESYDDHTFKLALRFLPQMLSQMGLVKAARLGLSFLPEVGMVLTGGVPKLVLMAEFSEDTHEEAVRRAKEAHEALADMNLPTKVLETEAASEKYWIVRRESFALLRKNLSGYYAAPFIDDFVVSPKDYPTFLPKLNALMSEYDLIYTMAGHIGNGNFHIIPLMDLSKPETRKIILELSPRVYDLVIQHGGTTTGEHNDGIIRTPYLSQLFGADMVDLFNQTKDIFDPQNIFNPGKKVHGTFADIERDIITKS